MRQPTSGVMRAAVLAGFAELTRKLGGDPVGLLRQAGLATRVLVDADLPIEPQKVCTLLEIAAIETGCADFGLRLAKFHDLGTLGPLGMLAREERSVGDALRTLADFLHLHNSTAHLILNPRGDTCEIAIALRTKPGWPTRQANELMIATTVGVLRALLGDDWNPLRVRFTHVPPQIGPAYQRVLRCAVEFGQASMAVLVAAADLRRPVASSNPQFQRVARLWVDALQARVGAGDDFADQVRLWIPVLMSDGHCTVEQLAQQLRLDRRTVHRRLDRLGTSFSQLLNAVRRERAHALVTGSGRSLGEIADLLGFAHPSSFARWFAAEFSTSASALRKRGSSAH